LSRTPHAVLIALSAALVLAAASPISASAAARATHAKRTAAHAAPAAAPASKVLASNDAVATNAGIVARQFDRWLDGLESSSDVSGLAVAVIKDDKVLLERGIGYANASTREPVTANTVFRLASLSKAFATAMAALMVQDGVISWDTKISNVLPTFQLADVNASQKVTVADILSHRVGLPHNTYDRMLEADEPYEELVTRLAEVPMACPVGDCYGYQNIAFSLIGDVTYAVTGDFYYHEVETRIFHPLGMETATYGRDALEGTKSWARPHRRAGRGWIPFTPNEAYYHVPPAAGVNASVRDMEQWLIAQMGGKPNVLSPAVLEVLHTPVVATDRERSSTPWRRGRLLNAQYALGWRIYDYAGQTLIFHAGAVQGYRAMIAFLPKYRFGAVMLWNCESAAPSGLMPMLMDRYLGLPEVNWAGIDKSDTEDLAGGSGNGN
jgi:beta-lactamase class C